MSAQETFSYPSTPTNLDLEPWKEGEPIPERFFVPRADIITVSGPHATFKTTAAEIIAGKSDDSRNQDAQRELKVNGLGFLPVGQWVRMITERETGQPFASNFEVTEEMDRFIDMTQEMNMRDVRRPHAMVINHDLAYVTDQPLEIEGRFSGFIGAKVATEEAGRLFSPHIERVLFYSSDQEEQLKVMANRERPRNPELSDAELIELGLEREKDLNTKAHEMFPYLPKNKGIYDPSLTVVVEKADDNGKTFKSKVPVYTIVIDSAGKTPHEVAREFHARLLQRNAIAELKRENFGPGLIGSTAFLTLLELPRCEGLLDRNQCNRLGTRTIDVYMGGKLTEQVPACTNAHARKIMHKRKLSTADRLIFSTNGFPVEPERSLA